MSETTATATEEELFSRDDVKQFASDDVEAGSAIGKMLSFFFLYTVFAMGLVAWWTFSDTSERAAEKEASTAAAVESEAADH
ncbi:MAG: hypothetical protein AB8G99_22035 [Planctomycetaceae bacterium]